MSAEDLREHEDWLREVCPIDLGDGVHRAGWQVLDEQLPEGGHAIKGTTEHAPTRNLWWAHTCTNGRRQLGHIDVTSGQRHTLVSPEPLHVEASVLCPECRDHGFIRAGRWVAA